MKHHRVDEILESGVFISHGLQVRRNFGERLKGGDSDRVLPYQIQAMRREVTPM